MKEITFTKAQRRALDKLNNTPKCAYELDESLSTLRALCKKGVAKDVTKGSLGSMFSPRTHFQFVRR